MTPKHLAAVAALAILPFISTYAQAPAAPQLSPATAEVVRLAGAGTSEDVVLAYVQNSQAPFELNADQILYLKDLGVPSPVVTAMLNHDSMVHAQAPVPVAEAPAPAAAPMPVNAPAGAPMAESAPPPAAAPEPMAAPMQAPPPMQMAASTPPPDVGYFYNDLAPYGTWADLPGFGWCWQPTVISTTVGWQPYCHGGHWMNTDAGWFWASDYTWGWAPFHYGRWQLHPTAGWVWFPARAWAPAWVVWRSGGDHCGWAPLPLHADFIAGVGWRYNGVAVSASFDFGLSVGCFSFVAMGHLCDHNVYSCRLPPTQVRAVYRSTTVINNYTVVNNTVVNRGVNVAVVEKAAGHPIERVTVHDYKGGAGAGAAAGVVRRAPGKPAPVTALTAVKIDSRGRIPTHYAAPASLTSAATRQPTSRLTTTATQGNKLTSTTTKATGPTHSFGSESANGKAYPAAGTGSTSKFTPTTGGTSARTTSTQMGSTTKSTIATGAASGKTTSTATQNGRTSFWSEQHTGNANQPGTTSSQPASKASQSFGSGSGAGNANANFNSSAAKSTSSFGNAQSEPKVSNRYIRSEDSRGASALTPSGNKATSATTSGASKYNTGSSSSSVYRGQQGSSVQHSGGNVSSSSGSSKVPVTSGYNKDQR
jgi:Family of unknown function (DUF6600)